MDIGIITFMETGRQMIMRQDHETGRVWLMGQAGGWMPVAAIEAPFTYRAL